MHVTRYHAELGALILGAVWIVAKTWIMLRP